MTTDMKVAPLRTLDDFLLESARFQIPNVQDLEKWGNRVTNNLLYYQSNYFLMSLIIFMIVGLIHPREMFTGMIAIAVALGLFHYFTNAKPSAERFKREHPILSLTFVLIGGTFIVYMFGSVLVFLLGVLLPISVTFIHASFRLRSMKNKIVNKLEVIDTKKTPMWLVLETLGMVSDTEWSGHDYILAWPLREELLSISGLFRCKVRNLRHIFTSINTTLVMYNLQYTKIENLVGAAVASGSDLSDIIRLIAPETKNKQR